MSGGFKNLDPNIFSQMSLASRVDFAGMEALTKKTELREESQRSMNLLATIATASTAEEFCRRLDAQIKSFDEGLDQDHEVGIKLVTFGQTMKFHVTGLGYHNPSLIFFYGETEDGDKVQLIQHVSQISFVLMSMAKPDPDQPRRPFGFDQAFQPDPTV